MNDVIIHIAVFISRCENNNLPLRQSLNLKSAILSREPVSPPLKMAQLRADNLCQFSCSLECGLKVLLLGVNIGLFFKLKANKAKPS